MTGLACVFDQAGFGQDAVTLLGHLEPPEEKKEGRERQEGRERKVTAELDVEIHI